MTSSVVSEDAEAVKLKVEFSGGLELLFSNRRSYELNVPSQQPGGASTNIKHLVQYLCDHVMTDSRKELFLLNETVRPGILVLINDADWELEGEAAYVVQDGDHILFVSTLHGG